jgi:hypothetical protein
MGNLHIATPNSVFHYFTESLTISCPIDASLFPFDTQTCTQTFRSQDYSYNDVNVFTGTFPYRTLGGATSNYASNTGRFRIKKLLFIYFCNLNIYSDICIEFQLIGFNQFNTVNNISNSSEVWWKTGVTVQIVLKRQSAYYTANFILPSIVITALSLGGGTELNTE